MSPRLCRLLVVAALAWSACPLVVHGAVLDDPPSQPADEVVLPPRLQQVQDRVDALRTRLAQSADLRLRILFSSSREPEEVRRPDGGFHAREVVTAAALYDQARGATDPLTLHLLLNRCDLRTKTEDRCDRVDLARRWTVADTQNQVAWLALVGALRGIHDDAGAREAFVRAAAASRWHEHTWDIMRVVDAAAPRDFPSLERLAWTVDAIGIGFAVPPPALQILSAYCKEGGRTGGAMRSACLRIIETMVRDSDSTVGVTVAPAFAAYAGESYATVASYQQRGDAFLWALAQVATLDAMLFDTFGAGLVDDAMAARAQPGVATIVMQSERIRADRYLAEHRIGVSDAAHRYEAGLSPAQREHRTKRLADARAWPATARIAADLSAGSARSTAASP